MNGKKCKNMLFLLMILVRIVFTDYLHPEDWVLKDWGPFY